MKDLPEVAMGSEIIPSNVESEESEPLKKSKLLELQSEEKKDATVSVTVLVKMPIVCLCQKQDKA